MIRHISIRNFAIIENVEIDFNDGLNIITGETGAGKSVVIEAVSLALGSRADTAFVRTGADKAVIQLVATVDGEEYVITREVSAAGRSLCENDGEKAFCSGANAAITGNMLTTSGSTIASDRQMLTALGREVVHYEQKDQHVHF